MLWAVKRIFFGQKGELVKDEHHPLKDLNCRELAVMAPLVVLIFWMGLFPNTLLDYSKTSIDHYVSNKDSYQLAFANENQEAAKVANVEAAKENGSKQ
jgi:NADH-quinone oxidoreductase subunit M